MREQVHADFENIGRAASLSTVCLYGGAPYPPQESVLRRGCDVVVGTPGRVKDHLERGSLKLQDLKCAASPGLRSSHDLDGPSFQVWAKILGSPRRERVAQQAGCTCLVQREVCDSGHVM